MMTQGESLQQLEKRKEALIAAYLELQDHIEEYNRQSYDLCCEIEFVNLEIAQIKSGNGAPALNHPNGKS